MAAPVNLNRRIIPPRAEFLHWLCLHPEHSLAYIEIDGYYVPLLVDEHGHGPVVPDLEEIEV